MTAKTQPLVLETRSALMESVSASMSIALGVASQVALVTPTSPAPRAMCVALAGHVSAVKAAQTLRDAVASTARVTHHKIFIASTTAVSLQETVTDSQVKSARASSVSVSQLMVRLRLDVVRAVTPRTIT